MIHFSLSLCFFKVKHSLESVNFKKKNETNWGLKSQFASAAASWTRKKSCCSFVQETAWWICPWGSFKSPWGCPSYLPPWQLPRCWGGPSGRGWPGGRLRAQRRLLHIGGTGLVTNQLSAQSGIIEENGPIELKPTGSNVYVMTRNNGEHQCSPYDPGIQKWPFFLFKTPEIFFA